MMTQGSLYAEAVANLDLDYVAAAGELLRKGLDACGAAETVFTPGDMTRYPISMACLDRFVCVAPKDGIESPWPGLDRATGVLVALGGGFCTSGAFNLLNRTDRFHWNYVGEKLMAGKVNASAVAVALLLDAVAGFSPERTPA